MSTPKRKIRIQFKHKKNEFLCFQFGYNLPHDNDYDDEIIALGTFVLNCS